MDFVPIPSQTAGPFFHLGCTEHHSVGNLTTSQTAGERISLICRVIDGDGMLVNDAMLELWQANAAGKYFHSEDTQPKPLDPAFTGFGRLATDQDGVCRFETIKPGRVAGNDSRLQAPHINVSVFSRGLLNRLATRIYFDGDAANAEDPVLALVPVERRNSLMAKPDPSRAGEWRIDIHLCGEHETVFFDV
jgi:protocatechuate 3,4-dioxygenase, alpha subunit